MSEKRDNLFDKFVTSYFDNLWTSPPYLDMVSKVLDMSFESRKQWNKNLEAILAVFQLPNQQMQQKTLHTVNTLLTEWRFENEELKLRIEELEKRLEEVRGK